MSDATLNSMSDAIQQATIALENARREEITAWENGESSERLMNGELKWEESCCYAMIAAMKKRGQRERELGQLKQLEITLRSVLNESVVQELRRLPEDTRERIIAEVVSRWS